MCLFIDTEQHKRFNKSGNRSAKIAAKDIYTLKRMDIEGDKDKTNFLTSPYRYTSYFINQLVKSKIVIYEQPVPCVEEGLHSYYKVDNAIQGLCFEEILVLCRIPKGSKYFLGVGGEIVSDKLELLEILYSFFDSTYYELIERIQFISESVDDAKPYLKTLNELKKFKKVSDEQDEFVVPYITKMLASYNIKIGV